MDRGRRERFGLGTVTLLSGALAAVSPLLTDANPWTLIGLLLAATGAMQAFHSFRRVDLAERRSAYWSGLTSISAGLLVLAAPLLVAQGLVLLLAGMFVVEAARGFAAVARGLDDRAERLRGIAGAVANTLLAILILALGRRSPEWAIAVTAGLRIVMSGWSMVAAPVHALREAGDAVLAELDLPDDPRARAAAEEVIEAEARRRPIDRGWIAAFVLTLFAIHVGRMQVDWTIVGLISPLFAVLGDVLMALLIAYGLVIPARALLRRMLRPFAQRATGRVLAAPADRGAAHGLLGWLRRAWLRQRLHDAVQSRYARYSVPAALVYGLQTGLPIVAVLVATVPVWGMSWYFDSENWAAGIYNSWAEHRTDTWRAAMVRAVESAVPPPAGLPSRFAVAPDGATGAADFSFLVIGDTGEGDPSQRVLQDRFQSLAAREDVKFLVISSDVIYPTGAMIDYETNFWLPFKGVTKPVYAIPGNHDWYDALEGFNATFLAEPAARAAIEARVAADGRLSGTTPRRVESLLRQAAWLRSQYRVPTGLQQAPFFELQAERFALIGADTGVVKKLDPAQLAWFREALARARGKFRMVILGHPVFAGGADATAGYEAFAALHRLLRQEGVEVVMAGDTHDLEYYREEYAGPGGGRSMHHFVNGGGGAYLSLGTALDWPRDPPTPTWAYHPTTRQVVEKTDRFTTWWKWPLWWWTREFKAWPFSAELLSAAFDYNVAPFYQSFVEVRVEPSRGRVRLVPHGVLGPLTWGEFDASAGFRPPGAGADEPVVFDFPMPGGGLASSN
jgi:uncharacterized membrane protein HdeD (DUF308 family)/3',5'-cyclic AMP phosphodiesterase CpdA